jgi:hypothetical protein
MPPNVFGLKTLSSEADICRRPADGGVRFGQVVLVLGDVYSPVTVGDVATIVCCSL